MARRESLEASGYSWVKLRPLSDLCTETMGAPQPPSPGETLLAEIQNPIMAYNKSVALCLEEGYKK